MPPKLVPHFLLAILTLTFTLTVHADELSSSNKQTIQKYMNGFNQADHAEILSCLTDDVQWILPGVYDLKGKEAFDKEIANDAFIQPPVITVSRVVEENDVVVAEGTVQTKKKTGEVIHLVFCDVFVMNDGKIKQLTSYLMEAKQN
jgi:ketosteroid isomerase-like protein